MWLAGRSDLVYKTHPNQIRARAASGTAAPTVRDYASVRGKMDGAAIRLTASAFLLYAKLGIPT
jgi:hypothetical protein